LQEWFGLMRYLFSSPVINGLLLGGLPVFISSGLVRYSGTHGALVDILLVSFLLIYVLLHWLLAFPIWDRYLLPLVPVLGALLARIVRGAASRLSFMAPTSRLAVGSLLLVIFLTVPAFQASAGHYPIGQERAAYEGIEDVISFFAQLPEGSVVYHHWLGWHYRYALSDAPVYLAYWPNPAWLARDVQAFGRREPRYITFPAWESTARVERHLDGVGYALDPVLTAAGSSGERSFTVYRVVPSPD
jgi:hypothetical protein